MKNQQGFFAIVAIVLIVIIGFLGVAVAYMFVGGATSSLNLLQSTKAFYIAEGGLEKATRYLLTPMLTGSAARISCASLSGNSNLTNSALGDGTFTVTTVNSSPVYTTTTLNGALTNSATTIVLTSSAGLAPNGRVLIDREAVNYSAISGNNLIGVIRGMNNTLASSHTTATPVSQYQCNLNSMGGIPNVTSPIYERELQQTVQLQEVWAIGNLSGNNFMFTHWNRPTELTWSASTLTNATNKSNLNAISLLSNADGWAVADTVGTNFIIMDLSTATWALTTVSGACSGQDLMGVSAVSAQEAWAVGARFRPTSCSSGNQRYTILKWNGSTWTKLAPTTIPADNNNNENLNAVHVIDTNGDGLGDIGFAVGNGADILKYNGSTWTFETVSVANNLFGVYVVSNSEAWAVGAGGRILKWNGSTWSTVTSPTGTQLNAIAMIDSNQDGIADSGWAVGNSGVAITYNGTSWTTQSPGSGALMGVAAFASNDVWAAGASGIIRHWDGSSWTATTSGVSVQLNAIAAVPSPGDYPFSAWKEVFP
jgi:Tfp pilus assembly protein PilX